jgi:hypothetical protein
MEKLFRAHDLIAVPYSKGTFLNPYLYLERRPLHSSRDLHRLANLWFESKFSLRFRSRALFCTGNIIKASEYCDNERSLISIEPKGDFKLCFSKKCEDMYLHFDKMPGFPIEKSQVWSELDSLEYQIIENACWDSAAASHCEMMVFANEFEYQHERF